MGAGGGGGGWGGGGTAKQAPVRQDVIVYSEQHLADVSGQQQRSLRRRWQLLQRVNIFTPSLFVQIPARFDQMGFSVPAIKAVEHFTPAFLRPRA